MPCSEYEAIIKEWAPALREYDMACSPTLLNTVSTKKRFEREDQAKVKLDAIEARRNRHVSGCPACKVDGHEPNWDSTARHHR